MLYEPINALKYLIGLDTVILHQTNFVWNIGLSHDLAKKDNIIER